MFEVRTSGIFEPSLTVIFLTGAALSGRGGTESRSRFNVAEAPVSVDIRTGSPLAR